MAFPYGRRIKRIKALQKMHRSTDAPIEPYHLLGATGFQPLGVLPVGVRDLQEKTVYTGRGIAAARGEHGLMDG
jgi:hypothetical protein